MRKTLAAAVVGGAGIVTLAACGTGSPGGRSVTQPPASSAPAS